MSKGNSHLFTGTSGAGKSLISEVVANGDKISPGKVVLITRNSKGKIIWMETGNDKSGLKHILTNHGLEFAKKGILDDDVPNYILEAIHQGNIIGTQGKRNPRTIYEFKYKGELHRIAIQISKNGYVVSANSRSTKG
ncbi:MAG: hypothetical protein LIO41_05450 [Ruminococcus sp.]|nr:hypothetical protein [Ruminococcus sp.]